MLFISPNAACFLMFVNVITHINSTVTLLVCTYLCVLMARIGAGARGLRIMLVNVITQQNRVTLLVCTYARVHNCAASFLHLSLSENGLTENYISTKQGSQPASPLQHINQTFPLSLSRPFRPFPLAWVRARMDGWRKGAFFPSSVPLRSPSVRLPMPRAVGLHSREGLLPCRVSSKMKIRLALDQFSLPPSPSADYHFATLSAWQYFFPGCNGLRPRPVGPVLVLEPRTGPGAPGEIGP